MSEDDKRAATGRDRLRAARPRVVSVAAADLIAVEQLSAVQPLPLVVRPRRDDVDLLGFFQSQHDWVEQQLIAHGGVLFRGFAVPSLAHFERLAAAVSPSLVDYSYGATPRTRLDGKVYTSTEYPAAYAIPMHNEMAYAREWPRKLWFHCVQPAAEGGETPLASSRRTYALIPPEVRERFERKKVMYVRNFSGGADLDLSWTTAFQTTDRSVVEAYCRRVEMQFEWRTGGRLRTRQICQASARHPVTGERVWFNQAHLFHVSSLERGARHALLATTAEQDLSRNAYYGDGTPIEPEALDAIRAAFAEATVMFPWQRGDVLLIDNMLVAHGRQPFSGPRKIVVAMSDAYSDPNGLA